MLLWLGLIWPDEIFWGLGLHPLPGHPCPLPGGHPLRGNARFRKAHHRPLQGYSHGQRRERNILRARGALKMWSESTLRSQCPLGTAVAPSVAPCRHGWLV